MSHRNPNDKADVSGASLKNPGRYRGRARFKLRPVGEPYAQMSDAEKAIWRELVMTMPWLRASDRLLLRSVCMLAIRLDDPDMGVNATNALSAALSKLGATPVDQSRVAGGDDDADDPADEFFTRH